jgi:hypothetical protein
VAAKLLLKPKGQVHLVYTDAVKDEAAKRLRTILREEEKIHVEEADDILTEEADANRIISDLKPCLEKLKAKGKSIGLNYTGGTKMMAVHSHRAVQELFGEGAIYSYLDANSLKMKIEGKGDYDVATADEARITLEKLLKLHEDYKKNEPLYETEIRCREAADALSRVNCHEVGVKVWRDTWQEFEKAGAFPQETSLIKSVADTARDKKISLNPQTMQKIKDGYQDVLAALKANIGDTAEQIAHKNGFDPKNGSDPKSKLANWLKGNWLEHHTLNQIRSIANRCNLNADGDGINLKPITDSGRKTESDVIALRGYQLFYFSCFAGDDRGKAKLKLLEAMIRAAQLGGDEARVALVSCVDQKKVDGLGKEVEKEWEKKGQVKVFGNSDLEKLSARLEAWFNKPMRAR